MLTWNKTETGYTATSPHATYEITRKSGKFSLAAGGGFICRSQTLATCKDEAETTDAILVRDAVAKAEAEAAKATDADIRRWARQIENSPEAKRAELAAIPGEVDMAGPDRPHPDHSRNPHYTEQPKVFPCCSDPDCNLCDGSGIYDPDLADAAAGLLTRVGPPQAHPGSESEPGTTPEPELPYPPGRESDEPLPPIPPPADRDPHQDRLSTPLSLSPVFDRHGTQVLSWLNG